LNRKGANAGRHARNFTESYTTSIVVYRLSYFRDIAGVTQLAGMDSTMRPGQKNISGLVGEVEGEGDD
jgi:hypothetical protein